MMSKAKKALYQHKCLQYHLVTMTHAVKDNLGYKTTFSFRDLTLSNQSIINGLL